MKCDKSNCGKQATRQVIGTFKSTPKDTPAVGEFSLFVCEGHKDVEWDDLITPVLWDDIRASFTKQGFAEPKKRLSKIFTKILV